MWQSCVQSMLLNVPTNYLLRLWLYEQGFALEKYIEPIIKIKFIKNILYFISLDFTNRTYGSIIIIVPIIWWVWLKVWQVPGICWKPPPRAACLKLCVRQPFSSPHLGGFTSCFVQPTDYGWFSHDLKLTIYYFIGNNIFNLYIYIAALGNFLIIFNGY